jgi:hypothetical protein
MDLCLNTDIWIDSFGFFVMTGVINGREIHRADCQEPRMNGGVELRHKNQAYFVFTIAPTLALTARM